MKASRQEKIKQLIEQNDIDTQEELAKRLGECGFNVTQATISRDIREMKLIKTGAGSGKQKYSISNDDKLETGRHYISALRDTVRSIEAAENIIVVKTASGMAMAVAAAIDAVNIEYIIGCIAGDDTIFCVVKSLSVVENVVTELSVKLAKI